jgi:hypothetical protein
MCLFECIFFAIYDCFIGMFAELVHNYTEKSRPFYTMRSFFSYIFFFLSLYNIIAFLKYGIYEYFVWIIYIKKRLLNSKYISIQQVLHDKVTLKKQLEEEQSLLWCKTYKICFRK